jgi:hypothetical protein
MELFGMRFLDWYPSERTAFWGKRVLLGVIFGGFWGVESLFIAAVFGTLLHAVRPGIQDWTTFLIYGPMWTAATILVTLAVRGEWPRRAKTT